jgi:hypothetical protein
MFCIFFRMMAGDYKKSNSIQEEELRIRQEEEQLFASIAAPPKTHGVASLLDNDEADGMATPVAATNIKQTGSK